MVIIRDAILNDAPSLYHLNCVSMGYEYPKEKTSVQLEKLLSSSRDKILVAELDICTSWTMICFTLAL